MSSSSSSSSGEAKRDLNLTLALGDVKNVSIMSKADHTFVVDCENPSVDEEEVSGEFCT